MPKKNKIKTIFMGTADFAVPSLKTLLEDENFEIKAVFTQPDKPVGRSAKIQKTPVKELALKKSIPVYQPEKISDYPSYSQKNCFPFSDIDLIVVVAYAQIIPPDILSAPKYGCINLHGSLLPKYRGSSCIQAAILNGDEKSGITIMKMDAGMDTGDIISQKEIALDKDETTGSLFEKLSQLGAKELPEACLGYISGNIYSQKQNEDLATTVKKTKKEDGRINWSNSSEYIERHIRAMHPWPGAWTKVEDKTLKILEAELANRETKNKKPGELFSDENQLFVSCGKGTLKIRRLQLEGKKPLDAEVFINGNKHLLTKVLK